MFASPSYGSSSEDEEDSLPQTQTIPEDGDDIIEKVDKALDHLHTRAQADETAIPGQTSSLYLSPTQTYHVGLFRGGLTCQS